MRVLILGGSGMLGHRLWMELSPFHEVWVTVRKAAAEFPPLPNVDRSRIREGVDAADFDNVIRAFASIEPELVINCIGLIKQHPLCNDPLTTIEVNARLPHRLSLVSRTAGIRLIHISTDCVFSGRRGCYTEHDAPDAEDLYGRTKLLGELTYPHTLTIRTSLIGRELTTRYGLTEWFLSQWRPVNGFKRAIFSGLTTRAFADVLLEYVIPTPSLRGLYQVSSEAISKHDVLQLMNKAFRKNLEIRPDCELVCDRSLDSSRFCATTGFKAPSWPEMIEMMAADPTPYDQWKCR